jgi:TruD family tRNA pseudouridine synthase
MNRKEIKEQELSLLAKKRKENPELFVREAQVDDQPFLEKIGITLPIQMQKNLAEGYLKMWPQDFIVEEILKDDTIQEVTAENIITNQEPQPTVYATLVKCGLSTIEAVEEMATFLNADKKKIQFAGIKDKDAVTAQMVSFRDIPIDEIQNISSPYFFLKNVHYGKGVMEVGGLQGNKFTILVRTNNAFDREKFLKNINVIKEEGFFNFFYSQRFGSPRFINWFWGLAILKGNYQQAVMSFLCSQGQRETPYFKNIREEIKAHFGNWQEIETILQRFPIIFHHEINVVKYLKNNPSNFAGALNQIPEQVQLWVFAYGSLLFNRKISEYIAEEKPLPAKIPLILSRDKNDWLFYKEFLEEDGISDVPFEGLKPFSFIQWKKRDVKTKERAQIHSVEFINEGVAISFTLPKACYATTFLSHVFELVSGMPPENLLDDAVDLKKTLGEPDIHKTLERFKEVAYPKTHDVFEKFE